MLGGTTRNNIEIGRSCGKIKLKVKETKTKFMTWANKELDMRKILKIKRNRAKNFKRLVE